MAETLCPDCGSPRPDWNKVCPACGAPPEPEHRQAGETTEGVRAADLEPYITLRYIARLFKVLAVLIIVMLLGEVVDESRESFARLAEVVQQLPDEALSDPQRFPGLEGHALAEAIVGGDFFSHLHEEHEPDIRRWLASVRAGA